MRALALIDGEHYPPVIRHALETLHAEEGLEFVGAVFLGGTEKLASRGVLDELGLPIVHEEILLRGVERGLREFAPEVVVDLSDEPITGYAQRFAYAAAALAAGARYRGADFELRPPHFVAVTTKPSVAVFGTGKRIGKTAVSAFLARFLKERGLDPVVVAMGRGGPEAPEIIDGSTDLLDAAALLDFSRAGRHASSDHFENALLARVKAVGARRCGGGLAGAPYVSNVVEAGRCADRLACRSLLFDGSGAAMPPIQVDRRVLVMGAHQPLDSLRRYLGPYRIRIADAVIVTMCEAPMATPEKIREIRDAVESIHPGVAVIETIFRPRPASPRSWRGRRAFVAVTAPETMGPRLAHHLETAHGIEVTGVSHALSNRDRLRADLATGLAAGPDLVLTELKAASIDVVAEAATQAGIDVGFVDNVPVCADGSPQFDDWLARALDLDALRHKAAATADVVAPSGTEAGDGDERSPR